MLLKGWCKTKNFYPHDILSWTKYETYYFRIHILLPALRAPFPALRTRFPINTFPNIKAPKVSDNIPRNSSSCYLISCFTVWLNQSVKVLEFSSDFLILRFTHIIIQKDESDCFSTYTTICLSIFLWVAPSFAEADVTEANGAKKCLAK